MRRKKVRIRYLLMGAAAAIATLALALISTAAHASPSLVSDPWPLPPAAQPSTCLYQEGTSAAVSVPVTKNVDGSVYCKWDLASVTRAAHSYQVWVSNPWGESAKIPFAFSAAVPAGTTGLQVVP